MHKYAAKKNEKLVWLEEADKKRDICDILNKIEEKEKRRKEEKML
jgi:hypothetical protein